MKNAPAVKRYWILKSVIIIILLLCLYFIKVDSEDFKTAVYLEKVVFSPDGEYVAAQTFSYNYIFHTKTGNAVLGYEQFDSEILFSPSSNYFFNSYFGMVSAYARIYDISKSVWTDAPQKYLLFNTKHMVGFTPDNDLIFLYKDNNQFVIDLIDIYTNTTIRRSLKSLAGKTYSTYFEALQQPVNGCFLVAADIKETSGFLDIVVELIDHENDRVLSRARDKLPYVNRNRLWYRAVTGGNKFFVITGDTINLYDLSTSQKTVISINSKGNKQIRDTSHICTSYDGELAAVLYKTRHYDKGRLIWQSRVSIYETAGGSEYADILLQTAQDENDLENIECIAVNAEKKILAIGCQLTSYIYIKNPRIVLMDVDSGTRIRTFYLKRIR